MRPEHTGNDYTHIINESFDKREITIINESGGVDLIVENTGKKYAAHYSGKNYRDRHNVTIDPKYVRDPETVTHETIHILQDVDVKRPAIDQRMKISRPKDLSAEERSLKEALTEAETFACVKDLKVTQVSFYDSIDEKNAASLKQDDVKIIKQGMKGKSKGESVPVVSRLFDKLHISQYKHVHRGRVSTRTAKEQRDHMEKKK